VQFRSGSVHSANGGNPSIMDYLNPEADKCFIQWTFDAYKQAVGDEMGKTVLGFRGRRTARQLEFRRLQPLVARAPRRVPEAQEL